MNDDRDREMQSNRDKKVTARHKRRKYVQGTRSYLHAVTNSIARRAGVEGDRDRSESRKDGTT